MTLPTTRHRLRIAGRQKFALLALLFFAIVPSGAAQHTSIPLDHQVYPLLRKGESLQLFHSHLLRILPVTRVDALSLLRQMRTGESSLSRADQQLLAQMLAEFEDPAPGTRSRANGERHAYRYEEGSTQLFFDLRGTQVFRFSRNRLGGDDENLSETTVAGAIRARLGAHFDIGLQARNTMILGSDDVRNRFDVDEGRIQGTTGDALFSDQATGYGVWHSGRFSLLIGRNQLGWGSGDQGQLALASRNEPLDLLQLQAAFSKGRFTFFHANLQGIAEQRYLAAHRLDLMLSRKFQVGVYEAVTYGGRGAEFGYLNPLVPYHVMEHHLGDKDNNFLGFDANIFAGRGVRIQAELLIDDLNLSKPIGTYWGNKLAYHAGVHWAQAAGAKTLELAAAYTRIDPWVYTHGDSVNVFAHYGESIGSRLGPNADRVRFELAWQPLRDTRWRAGYAFVRKGKGDLFTAHRIEDGTNKGYLAGTLEKRHEFSLRLRQQVRKDIFTGFDFTYQALRNADREPGVRRNERFMRFFLDVNY